MKWEKCEFLKKEIEFYGVRFTGEGIRPSKMKVKAMQECREPSSEGVRRFLQVVGYMSRFISNVAQIAAPLRQPTKSASPFSWGVQKREAFDLLAEQTIFAYSVLCSSV